MLTIVILRVLVAVFLSSFADAVSKTAGQPAAASPSATATVYPGAGTYKYAGCYNETTGYTDAGGPRALSAGGWTMVSRPCDSEASGEIANPVNLIGGERRHDPRYVPLLLQRKEIRRPRIWTRMLV
jgi:hypothetical protein